MSTAIDNVNATASSLRTGSIFWRFVWKEFRMLRGLWLAVSIMGMLVQGTTRMFVPFSSDIPSILFSIALSATVLYAAGAAATIFSVEHEEETYDFLARLPATWLPVFAGKLLATTLSALLLAYFLTAVGFAQVGRLLSPDTSTVLGILGVAIFEALAWGTFFSLIIRRPLVAAVLTLVVGAVVVNIAVNLWTPYTVAAADPRAYVAAIPVRLAIVVAVTACNAMIARRWLSPGAQPAFRSLLGSDNKYVSRLASVLSRIIPWGVIANRGVRRRILARLLWQSWRESWKLLPLPLGVALALAVTAGLLGGVTSNHDVEILLMAATPLFAPALYGAMAFHADQRRGSYRFLAEHAARPRYVWSARHVVWLGALVAVSLLLLAIFGWWFGSIMKNDVWRHVKDYILYGSFQYNSPSVVYSIATDATNLIRLVSLASFGGFVAYSIGQFCSMVLRSEILAAFIALVLSFVVSAWVAAVFAWQLSGWIFLFPVFAGFMLATWLRAPDWIAGRNSQRAWLKPALAIIAAFLFTGIVLPRTRLAQVSAKITRDAARHQFISVDDAIANELRSFGSRITPEARETAQMYITAAENMTANPAEDLLKPWEDSSDIVDEDKIPTQQLKAFQAAKEKQLGLIRKESEAAIKSAVEATNRPTCHFDFDLSTVGTRHPNKDGHSFLVESCPIYGKLDDMLTCVALAEDQPTDVFERLVLSRAITKINRRRDDQPTEGFDRLLAALRMSARLAQRPTFRCVHRPTEQRGSHTPVDRQLGRSEETHERRVAQRDRTTHGCLSRFTQTEDALLADHLLIRNVLVGKDTPLVMSQLLIPVSDYLAFPANQLPWERERALRALDRITLFNLSTERNLELHVSDSQPRERGVTIVRFWMRSEHGGLPEPWEIEEPAAATSFLTLLEYKARVSIPHLNRAFMDNEVCRRATLLKIALAMYRLDHQEYPPRLADLVPKYVPQLPLDPYSSQSFSYEPAGLNLPLEWWESDRRIRRTMRGTPFFWSVGIGDVRLVQYDRTSYEPADETAPETGAQQKSEPVYAFHAEESWVWGDEVLVFELPK